MVNERKCETVEEEECSMVSLKNFLEIISMISFTKYLCSMVSLKEKINFLIDDKFYKIFSLNAW